MTWVYKRTEPGLWTVGFYSPGGEWHTDSDHGSSETAAWRVHYLNGGQPGETEGWPSEAELTQHAERYQ